jgi:7-cyano-7-deazaguanine synthase in queuosine biosynthesis
MKVFSDAFEQPKEGDILYKESGERIFTMNLNCGEDGLPKYKYVNGEIEEIIPQKILKTYHNDPNNRKAVFMNSGGPDTLATAILMHEKYELHSFYLDGHLPNRIRAMSMAEKIVKKYCVSHEVMDIGNRAVIEYDYLDPSWQSTKQIKSQYKISRYTIPFQSMVYYALAVVYAVQIGTDIVITGSDGKIDQLTDLFNEAHIDIMKMGCKINFIHPLVGFTDEDILKILENDLELRDYTVSCDYEVPCGGCWKCGRRINKLKLEEKIYA